jgi:methylenetetrahydrofolate dehydrogenase (NADP+)/methenyltetrahydrofolate cyclohydrolase
VPRREPRQVNGGVLIYSAAEVALRANAFGQRPNVTGQRPVLPGILLRHAALLWCENLRRSQTTATKRSVANQPKLIDGRAVAETVYLELRGEVETLKAHRITPGLAVVLVGDDPASRAYVRSKDKMCRELGLYSVKLELPADTTQAELLGRVEELNRDRAIHGILVQSPPPPQIDEAAIIRALDPAKDVDGFHPINIAKLALGDETGFVPCTPLGCLRLLRESGVEISGAHVVVLGRSMIVGKPLALLLMQ